MNEFSDGYEAGYADGLEAGRRAGYEDGLAEAPGGGGATTWGAFGIVSGAFLAHTGFALGSVLRVGVPLLLALLAPLAADSSPAIDPVE